MQNYLFFAPPEDYPPTSQNLSNAGSWTLEEDLSYAIFIDIHKKSMTSKKKMREMQFYEKLSGFIATRTSSQCRSHHQKMFDKYKYISKIVEQFKGKVGVPQYKLKFQEGIQKMKLINQRFSKDQQPQTPTHPHSEALVPSPPANNTFFIAPPILNPPFFFNNFYYFCGDCQLGATDTAQSQHLWS